MIIYIILCIGIIFILLYFWKKSKLDIKYPNEIIGLRINGIKLAGYLGFPTVNIILNVSIPCGFYKGTTEFGNVTLVVGKNNNKRVDLHFDLFNTEIDKLKYIKVTNIIKIINSESDIITTYNSGCDC